MSGAQLDYEPDFPVGLGGRCQSELLGGPNASSSDSLLATVAGWRTSDRVIPDSKRKTP
jgi:hypothetical protein